MVSAKKIHEWFLKALEEPFFRAEMYRAEILLQRSQDKDKAAPRRCGKISQGPQKRKNNEQFIQKSIN